MNTLKTKADPRFTYLTPEYARSLQRCELSYNSEWFELDPRKVNTTARQVARNIEITLAAADARNDIFAVY